MRPLILITNDDGIQAPGLKAAADAVLPLGEVIVVAPPKRQTAMGRSFPRSDEQGVIERAPEICGGAVRCYAVSGSPAQSVAHAVLEICSRPPALCISGLNDGENLGGTILVSGTVGAAMEAAGFGIPALAVSVGPEDPDRFCCPYSSADWQVPIALTRLIASRVLSRGLPPGVALLNVNIPWSATLLTEVRFTVQSRQNHYVWARPGERDFSKPGRLPVIEQIDRESLERDGDLHAFSVDCVVSITPLTADLTARDATGAPLRLDVVAASALGLE